MPKTKQNLVHIKIEHNELIESKREILSTEADLIKILKAIKKYRLLRKKELILKSKFLRKLKETRIKIQKMEEILPKIKKEFFENESPTKKPLKIERKKDNLTKQLEEIQKKLKELE